MSNEISNICCERFYFYARYCCQQLLFTKIFFSSNVDVCAVPPPAQLLESGGCEQGINFPDPNMLGKLLDFLAPIPDTVMAPAYSGPSQPGPSQPGPSQQKRAFELM